MSNRSVNSNRSSNRSSSRSVSSANDEVDPTDTACSRRMSAPGSSSGEEVGAPVQSSQSLSVRDVYNALDDDLEVDKPKKLFKARELVVSTKELLPSVTVTP